MSSDNGIYIAHFPQEDCYRVAIAQNIQVIDDYTPNSPERLEILKKIFGKAIKLSSLDIAKQSAYIMEEESAFYLEYGIQYIGDLESFEEPENSIARENELMVLVVEAQKELEEIRLSRRKSSRQNLVGRYFKFLNTYNENTWNTYRKITRVDKQGSLRIWEFEQNLSDSDTPVITVELDGIILSNEGFQEIDGQEFFNAWNKLMKFLTEFEA